MAQIVTKTDLARRLGVSAPRVSQLVKRGLPVLPDGKVELASALTWISTNLDRTNSSGSKVQTTPAVPAAQVSTLLADPGRSTPQADPARALMFGRARAALARAKREERLEKLQAGELFERRDVVEFIANTVTMICDALLSQPDRMAATLAAVNNTAEVHRLLKADVNGLLALTHIRVIDGTGAGPARDQTIVVDHGRIDAGRMPGPKMLITVGYIEGPGSFAVQMPELKTAGDGRQFVEYWASQGAHSFKAYMNISRAALQSAIQAAHARGLQVTGHLCSVGFHEAAVLGIDNLEHSIITDVEYLPGKQPGLCMPGPLADQLAQLNPQGETMQSIIKDLVAHNVAITSALAVFEVAPPLQPRFLDALAPHAALNYLAARDQLQETSRRTSALRVQKEIAFERAFVAAGGLLVAGCDPTGNGSAMAGFGDQRNIELLVEGGFTPLEAIHIATLNGARLLKQDAEIGSIAVGKAADLVVLDGDPSQHIADIKKVRLVFKDGLAYDPAKLLQSVNGRVGIH